MVLCDIFYVLIEQITDKTSIRFLDSRQPDSYWLTGISLYYTSNRADNEVMNLQREGSKKPMSNYHIIRNGGDSFIIYNPPTNKKPIEKKRQAPRKKGKLLREREV